jgi:hypothetical protein
MSGAVRRFWPELVGIVATHVAAGFIPPSRGEDNGPPPAKRGAGRRRPLRGLGRVFDLGHGFVGDAMQLFANYVGREAGTE